MQGLLQSREQTLSPTPPDDIDGLRLRLRLVQPNDADYVQGLRTDPKYNSYLSSVHGTVEDQRAWIVAYKSREAARREFYYVIERKDGQRCGLVRLYDIGLDTFTWGSWILDANKPPKAALESAILSFGVGFEQLDLPKALVDVRIANEKALGFYLRLGMSELRRDQRDVYFVYPRQRFERDRAGHVALLHRFAEP